MKFARKIADTLGHNSPIVRALRRVRGWATGDRHGHPSLIRSVNGMPMRVLRSHGYAFPAVYDEPVARYLRRHLQPGDICLNVGANLGLYALQFARWSGPSGRVFAFEPNPETVPVLQAHVKLNGMADRVRVIPKAVADRAGTATFYAAGTDGMSRLGLPNGDPCLLGNTRAITVELETLDAFCDRERVQPDALMVDVEGAEFAVLAGAASLFAIRRRFLVVVEIHPGDCGVDRPTFEKLLERLGVRPVPLSGQSDPLDDYGHIALEPTSPHPARG